MFSSASRAYESAGYITNIAADGGHRYAVRGTGKKSKLNVAELSWALGLIATYVAVAGTLAAGTYYVFFRK